MEGADQGQGSGRVGGDAGSRGQERGGGNAVCQGGLRHGLGEEEELSRRSGSSAGRRGHQRSCRGSSRGIAESRRDSSRAREERSAGWQEVCIHVCVLCELMWRGSMKLSVGKGVTRTGQEEASMRETDPRDKASRRPARDAGREEVPRLSRRSFCIRPSADSSRVPFGFVRRPGPSLHHDGIDVARLLGHPSQDNGGVSHEKARPGSVTLSPSPTPSIYWASTPAPYPPHSSSTSTFPSLAREERNKRPAT